MIERWKEEVPFMLTLMFAFLAVLFFREVDNEEWRSATRYVVEQHNQKGYFRKLSVEEMTPRKLAQITNPCVIWDWRERGKVCDKK